MLEVTGFLERLDCVGRRGGGGGGNVGIQVWTTECTGTECVAGSRRGGWAIISKRAVTRAVRVRKCPHVHAYPHLHTSTLRMGERERERERERENSLLTIK